ncbi:uncharacterized protein [Euphorbia lathyris]|uniref:uncharacterized protein isoform X2 n=1 Tax=Euphorbia lathyris TaxID=212925 RepID=UPI003313BAFF
MIWRRKSQFHTFEHECKLLKNLLNILQREIRGQIMEIRSLTRTQLGRDFLVLTSEALLIIESKATKIVIKGAHLLAKGRCMLFQNMINILFYATYFVITHEMLTPTSVIMGASLKKMKDFRRMKRFKAN